MDKIRVSRCEARLVVSSEGSREPGEPCQVVPSTEYGVRSTAVRRP